MGVAGDMTSSVHVLVYRLNPLSLVEIVLVVATEITDMEEAIQFISSIQDKVCKHLRRKSAANF